MIAEERIDLFEGLHKAVESAAPDLLRGLLQAMVVAARSHGRNQIRSATTVRPRHPKDGQAPEAQQKPDMAVTTVAIPRPFLERARRKRPENLGAYDLYLRALPHTQSAMPEDAAIAIGYLEEALELDPNYAVAHAALAVSRETRFRGAGFDEADRTEGVRHARLALALGTDDATALAYAALTVLHLAHDFEAASGAIARALSLNGSCATALYWGAHIHAWSGDPVLAEDYANRALRLSPFDPLSYEGYVALGAVRLRLRRYDDAAACFAKAVQANPRFSVLYALQASALAMAGRIEEANALARRLVELEPTFRALRFLEFAGFVKPEIREAFAVAFREAGLPE